jgi:hypothetical protein
LQRQAVRRADSQRHHSFESWILLKNKKEMRGGKPWDKLYEEVYG